MAYHYNSHGKGRAPLPQPYPYSVGKDTFAPQYDYHQNSHQDYSYSNPTYNNGYGNQAAAAAPYGYTQTNPFYNGPRDVEQQYRQQRVPASSKGRVVKRAPSRRRRDQGMTTARKFFLVIMLVGIAAVAVAGVVLNQEKFPDIELGAEIRNGDDYIGVVFLNRPNQAQFDAFTKAAARWSDIIQENLVAPTGVRANSPVCGANSPNAKFQVDTPVDHLIIFAEVTPIDGEFKVLGQAGPCVFDDDAKFPVVGIMSFDVADLDRLDGDGTLEAVILHEMGHVLGLGTLWTSARQGRIVASGVNARDRLIQNPVFIGTNFNPDGDGENIGVVATAEYNKLGGEENFVPVEDGIGTTFSSGKENARGSIDGHWDIDAVPGELMVFAINPADKVFPLSKVTIGGLADLGYSVDIEKADAFAILKNNGNLNDLISNIQADTPWANMEDDIKLDMNWTENQQFTFSLDD